MLTCQDDYFYGKRFLGEGVNKKEYLLKAENYGPALRHNDTVQYCTINFQTLIEKQ